MLVHVLRDELKTLEGAVVSALQEHALSQTLDKGCHNRGSPRTQNSDSHASLAFTRNSLLQIPCTGYTVADECREDIFAEEELEFLDE